MVPILLVNPPFVPCVSQSTPVEDLGIGYLVALLRREGHSLRLIDANMEQLSVDHVLAQVGKIEHAAVLVWLMYRTFPSCLEIVRRIRELTDRPIIGCSYAATLSCHQLLCAEPAFDALILGEVEGTLLELAAKWLTGTDWRSTPGLLVRDGTELRLTAPRALIQNLDDLPFPSRDYLPQSLQNRPVADILSSRGCHKQCTFCNVHALYAHNAGPVWRGRSAANVVDEIEHLCQEYAAHRFEFVDECFIGPGELGSQRAWDIADEILARKLTIDFRIFCRIDQVSVDLFSHLKKAGLCTVNVGIESGSDRVLQRLKKGITVQETEQAIGTVRDLGLVLFPSMIMFEPTMTMDELGQNLKFLERHQLWNSASPTTVIPFAGTEMTQSLEKEGLLSRDEFILTPYIPQVRFQSSSVASMFQRWTAWQDACDAKHDGLLYKLSAAYCILLEQSFQESEQRIWQKLGNLYSRQKRLEIAYVDREMQSLKDGLSGAIDYAHAEIELSDLSQETEQVLRSCPSARQRLRLPG